MILREDISFHVTKFVQEFNETIELVVQEIFDHGDYDLILSGPNVRSSARLDITDLILEQLQRVWSYCQIWCLAI